MPGWIDRIAGVSIGSLVGAGLAAGHDPDAIARHSGPGSSSQPDGRLHAAALLDDPWQPDAAALAEYFGETRIEELQTRYFCLSCDLIAREAVIHRTGRLWEAISASLAIPGIFPPISTPEGRLLVDGGVLDNLPVATMARSGEGPVIAVDVTGRMGDFKKPVRPGIARLGRPIRRYLTGSEAELPRLGETIVRTVTVGSVDTAEAARRHADLVIEPAVEEVGLLDWSQLEPVVEAGRAAARAALEDAPEWFTGSAAREGPARRMSPSPRRARLMRRRESKPLTVLAVASLGVFMAFVDATIVNIAFPDIAESFPETDISSLSWILNAYNIVFAAFLVAAGKLADLLGRRRVYLLGLIVFTVASVLCAVAPSAGALTGFRVLQALGAALLVPSSLGLVLQAFPADRRAHAVALLSAVAALAAGIGPSLGGVLVAADSWRLVFLVNLPVGIAAFVLARRYLVESREPGRRQLPDLLGAGLFAIAIAALVLAVVKGQEWGWTSARVLGSFAVALATGALFVRRCTWHGSPLIDLGLLGNRTFSVSNAMTILAAAGFYGYTLVHVLFLTQVWQYSVLEAGLAITPGPIVAVIVAGPTSRIAERFGHRWVLVAGGLLWAAGVFWFVQRVGLTPDYVSEWLPGMILAGLGAGTLFPNLSGTAVASAPGEAFATATGLNSVARQVGAALGVAAVIAILGTPNPLDPAAVEDAFDNAWSFSALCLLLAGIGCLGVGRLRSDEDLERSPSLGSAARLVLGRGEERPTAEPRPAPRELPPAPPAKISPRPESAADFLGARRSSRACRASRGRRSRPARARFAFPPATGSSVQARRQTRCT